MTDIGRATSVNIGQGPQWQEIDQALGQLAGNKGGKHLRATGDGTRLYVSEKGQHRLFAAKDRQNKYANAVGLIKQSIDNTFGAGAGNKIFSDLGITKNSHGLKLADVNRLRGEIARLQDAQQFSSANLGQAKAPGAIIKPLTDVPGFHVFETHDKAESQFTGGKVHISVAPKDVGRAWDVVLPILLEHSDTIKEFKITDMAAAKGKLDNPSMRRVHDGAQISVYLRVPEGSNNDRDFARVMKEVSGALQQAGIGSGAQPDSDLRVNQYISYRHEIDDVRPNSKVETQRDGIEDLDENDFRQVYYMPSDHPHYAEHLEAMRQQPIYQALRSA
jgi:hypothetical protein